MPRRRSKAKAPPAKVSHRELLSKRRLPVPQPTSIITPKAIKVKRRRVKRIDISDAEWWGLG